MSHIRMMILDCFERVREKQRNPWGLRPAAGQCSSMLSTALAPVPGQSAVFQGFWKPPPFGESCPVSPAPLSLVPDPISPATAPGRTGPFSQPRIVWCGDSEKELDEEVTEASMCDGEMGWGRSHQLWRKTVLWIFPRADIHLYSLLFINLSITLLCKFYKYSLCVCVCVCVCVCIYVFGMGKGRMSEHQMSFYQRGICSGSLDSEFEKWLILLA